MRFARIFYPLTLVCFALPLKSASAVQPKVISGVEQSVVRVLPLSRDGKKWLGISGTGFVVADGKHIVTNAHVVEGTTRVAIIGKGNDSKPYSESVQVVWVSKDYDLAVLSMNERRLTPLLIYSANIKKGETVFALGYPGAADQAFAGSRAPSAIIVEATLTRGEMGRQFRGKWIKSGPEVGIIQHSAHINSGNSGGPLFDACGRVVGLNTAKALSTVEEDGAVNATNGIYFSSDAQTILNALSSAGIAVKGTTAPCSEDQGLISTITSRSNPLASKGILPLFFAAVLVVALFFVASRLYFSRRGGRNIALEGAQKSSNKRVVESPRSPSILLKVSSPNHGDQIFNLGFVLNQKGYAIVGRDQGGACDLVVDDQNVSRQHLRFDLQGMSLLVTDLRSRNGTFVSGKKVASAPTPVHHGEKIAIGKTHLTVTWID